MTTKVTDEQIESLVRSNDYEAMRVFFNGTSRLEYRTSSGLTPLLIAAKEGLGYTCTVLVECGASIHSRDSQCNSALHLAAMSGAFNGIETLLSRGAHRYALNADGLTPLQCAILHCPNEQMKCWHTCTRLMKYGDPDIHTPNGIGLYKLALNHQDKHVANLISLRLGKDLPVVAPPPTPPQKIKPAKKPRPFTPTDPELNTPQGMKRRRCCKVAYSTEAEAQHRMRRLKKRTSGRFSNLDHVYLCPRCYTYHLTSQPYRWWKSPFETAT
ncbi:ankyrin repeat domain-containing protein [Pseudoxanthomonas daejeonensis]|uniref:ankyrin repeat domain-containing protein n=1 Tax=Pseudoxanthomonas daejeonensis TaxID=266062 RepID=UPI001391E96F|nr:ankyrin repeat domain-containing protein [Pseudoxanthomonas daejeonensis]